MKRSPNAQIAIVLLGFVWNDVRAVNLGDADAAQAKAEQKFIERFKEFYQDKNILSRPKSLDGSKVSDPNKGTYDRDDGNTFRSDLTYHSNAYKTTVEVPGQGQAKPTRETMESFVSEHGTLSEAGGSSELERVSYQQEKKFSEQDQKEEPPKEEGIRYKGMFKITTTEVRVADIDAKAQKAQASASTTPGSVDLSGSPKPKSDPKKDEEISVERRELRDEARTAIAAVGKNGAQTLIESARDPQFKTDQKALANGLILRAGGYEGAVSMFKNALAKLSQRRTNIGMPDSDIFGRPQLSEEKPRCEEWVAETKAKLPQLTDPALKKELEDRMKDRAKMCQELSQTSFREVSPRYRELPDDPNKIKLQAGTAKDEDGIERDLRVQLEMLDSAGKTANEVASNWNYSAKDDQVRLTRFKEDGTTEEQSLTVAEQLDSYNDQLEAAKASAKKVSARLPGVAGMDPTQYRIESKTKSIMEINAVPKHLLEQESGIQGATLESEVPQTYEQLLKANADGK